MTETSNPQTGPRYRVADLVFDQGNRSFERNGAVKALPKLSYKLLHCLIRNAPNTVSFDQLIEEVWGRTVVSPETVTQRVKLVRDAIGDDHENPTFIETRRGHGYRLIPPVESLQTTTGEQSSHTRLIAAIIAFVAVVMVVFYGLNNWRTDVPADVSRSIAVLPLVNSSADPEQEYFSDGLSDELISLLTRVPGLRVAARTSSFSLKGEKLEIPAIASKLQVSHVLDGSVRKSGNDLRIAVQLSTDDGYNLWSETYDRTLNDIFAVQREIAASVVDALRLELLDAAPLAPQTSPEVYNLYLKARYFDNLKGKDNWEKAVAHYQQALAIDPGYAPAWAGLSVTYRYQANSRLGDFDARVELARQAAQKALALDGKLALAWSSLSQIDILHTWDWSAADAAIQKAIEFEPDNPDVLNHAASVSTVLGRLDETIALLQRSIAIDPLNQSPYNNLGLAYMNTGRLTSAEQVFRQLLELNPDYPWALKNLGRVQLLKGEAAAALASFQQSSSDLWSASGVVMALSDLDRHAEAQTALAELEQEYANGGAFQIAAVHAWRGNTDGAFEWLQRSYESREPSLIFVPTDAFFGGLHSDPRWTELRDNLGLPELRPAS